MAGVPVPEAVVRCETAVQPSGAHLYPSLQIRAQEPQALAWVAGGMGWGEEVGEPASLGCLSVYLSIFPNLFPSLSSPSSLSLCPVSPPPSHPLASSAPHCPLPLPPALGAHSENTTQARPCLAHTQCHGMAPLPAQGKPRAWPAPHSPLSARKAPPAHWMAGLPGVICPPLPVLLESLPSAFPHSEGLLKGRVAGACPWTEEVGMGMWAGLVPLAPHHLVHPTPGPPAAFQLHPRAQAAMTVTVWSCPGQKRGLLRTVALGAWAQAKGLPMVAQSGPSPLAAQACDARPSRTGSADPADTAQRGRRVTSRTWAPEPPSQRLRVPQMCPAPDLLWLGHRAAAGSQVRPGGCAERLVFPWCWALSRDTGLKLLISWAPALPSPLLQTSHNDKDKLLPA